MHADRRRRRHRVLFLTAAVAGVQTAGLLRPATRAAADDPTPPPSAEPEETADSECENVPGAARDVCEQGGDGGGSGEADSFATTLDPLASLARGCADAAAWIIDKLSEAVASTATVDFTNPAFLRQYAVVFAASTVLTLVLWLLAVAKRAVRGIPLTEALTEAIGFLWLTVLASAFTPLILYTLVTATDAVTDVIAAGTGSDTDKFFGSFSEALKKGDDIGGGPVMLIVVSLVSVLAAGVLWLELVIRAALLYVGALLGTVVYSGLVDKNLWGHVRRWAGIMIAVILVKPVIVIVLGLAGALASNEGPNAFSAIVSGLAIILLAIFASAMIYRFVPGFGDEIVRQRNASADPASRTAAAVVSSPAAMLRQGITTHSARGGAETSGSGGGPSGATPRPANPLSGGVAAHASRGTGSATSQPTAPPPPRTGNGGGSTTSHRTGGDRG
ncbi:hypothetical protein F0L17_11650 [Streptomyces sp. TRM43335]|uniref:Integral membrane protein n=1 Tax=Streptomyces taklimakanensis TaxID=2569853 RepID=A0A6G2BBX1_9ACTN|nr:hypothetical protein [Streptomyces taklimakanensis]MTE19767.1 hypothetical protein [Streptomyces taklimakanensis]